MTRRLLRSVLLALLLSGAGSLYQPAVAATLDDAIKAATMGDDAEMCIIELVDYNDLMKKETTSAKSKTRRG